MNIRQILAAASIAALAPLSAQAAGTPIFYEGEATHGNSNSIDQTAEGVTLPASGTVIVSGYMGAAKGTTSAGDTYFFTSPDSYSFSVAAGTTVTAVLSAYVDADTPDPTSNLNAANPTLRFYNTSTGLFGSSVGAKDTDANSTAPLTLSYTFANAGDYRIVVGSASPSGSSGDRFNGATGWNYDLQMTTVAAAVPEPESIALMLAGLGVVGALSRRRKLHD
jgi:PEP-CTERM motif